MRTASSISATVPAPLGTRTSGGSWSTSPGTDPQDPDYGIVSYRDEDLALTARGEGDTYIDLKRMWGDHPSQRQGWHFYSA